MAVNDEVTMEIEMLRAIAGDENVEDPAIRDDSPSTMRSIPVLRILIARETGVQPELVLWMGFHSPAYPGNGGEECVPLVKVELEPNAPISHRPEQFEVKAKEVAAAEGGQMCINQVYQCCVDCLVEAEESKAKNAHSAASAAADASAAASADPTIRIGIQMSPEVFRAWKLQFDAERAQKSTTGASKAQRGDTKVRLTGKQMWDQTLASADWKLFEKAAGQEDDEEEGEVEDVEFIFGDEDEEEEDGAVPGAAADDAGGDDDDE